MQVIYERTINQLKNFCRDSKPQTPASCDRRRQREPVEVSIECENEKKATRELATELQLAINCRSSDGFFLSLLTSPTNTIALHAAFNCAFAEASHTRMQASCKAQQSHRRVAAFETKTTHRIAQNSPSNVCFPHACTSEPTRSSRLFAVCTFSALTGLARSFFSSAI